MAFDLKRYFVLLCLGGSVVLNVSLWVFVAIYGTGLGDEAILHYDALQGIDLIGPGNDFFVLPLIGLIIIGVNFFLSAVSIKSNRLVARILSGLTVLAQIILIVAVLLLVNINTQYA